MDPVTEDATELDVWLDLQAGNFERAQASLTRLLIVATDREQRARLEAALGLVLQRIGMTADASNQYDRAIELASGSDEVTAFVLGMASLTSALLGRPDLAERQARRAIVLGEKCGQWIAVRQASTTLITTYLTQGRAHEALAASDAAIGPLPDGPATAEFLSIAYVLRSMALFELDRPAESHATIADGIAIAQEAGDVGQLSWFFATRSMLHFMGGDWDQALRDTQSSLDSSARTGALVARPLAWGIAACIEGLRGNADSAWRLIDLARSSRMGPFAGTGEEWVTLAVAATTTDPDVRYHALCEAWHRLRGWPYLLAWKMFALPLVSTAVARGDLAVAEAVTRRITTGAEMSGGVPSALGTARCCEGSLRGSSGLLAEGIALLRGTGRPLPLGLACLEAAQHAHRRGDESRATELLAEASNAFHSVGATTLSAVVARSVMRAPAAAAAEADPWSRLTPAEQRVARLAATGQTNPQIGTALELSPRTVQSHMASICRKYSVSSRVQLAARLANLG